jgi:NitT/TauT family transport system substrate-binding protein
MKKFITICTAALLFCSACSDESAPPEVRGNGDDYSKVTIRLAQQYGMQYAPAYIMQEFGLLEKHLPGVHLKWSRLAGGSAMNEALIAGQLDVAFMGLPPLLIAWSKGVDYRIAAGICVPPSELMIRRDKKIKSIADLKKTDKIAVPGVGSIQHIMLAMAAQKTLGDAKSLDGNILPMANPDAYAALISGADVVGHFASMPYIDREANDCCESILSAKEAYGQEASIISVSTKSFHDNQKVYNGFIAALNEAIDLVKTKDPDVIKVIAKIEKISEEEVLRYLQWPGTMYDSAVYGSMGLAVFMFEQGYIEKYPKNTADIMWPNVKTIDEKFVARKEK